MLDDFEGITAAFSFGVGDDASWDLDIASRSIPTYQYDHTVENSPVQHPLLHFRREKIGSDSLASIMSNHSVDAACVLKMDIEGDEWEVLKSATNVDLVKFRQIICEFHGFDRATLDSQWQKKATFVIKKLLRSFRVVHLHGNNNEPITKLGTVKFPSVIEVTFANRSRYLFEKTKASFPTSLDSPNSPERPDLVFHL